MEKCRGWNIKSIVDHHLFALHDCLLVDMAQDALVVEVVGDRSEGAPHHSVRVFRRHLAVLDLVLYGLDDLILQGPLVVLVGALKVLMG